MAWLRPFCGDASVAVRPRIEVLQILENNFPLRDRDLRLLLLYRTQAVLKDRQVTHTHTYTHTHMPTHIKARTSTLWSINGLLTVFFIVLNKSCEFN